MFAYVMHPKKLLEERVISSKRKLLKGILCASNERISKIEGLYTQIAQKLTWKAIKCSSVTGQPPKSRYVRDESTGKSDIPFAPTPVSANPSFFSPLSDMIWNTASSLILLHRAKSNSSMAVIPNKQKTNKQGDTYSDYITAHVIMMTMQSSSIRYSIFMQSNVPPTRVRLLLD